MIVKPAALAHAIRDGSKTTHRRPVTTTQPSTKLRKGRTRITRPFRPDSRTRLSIQVPRGERSRETLCHVDVLHATMQPLGHLTPDQARHEGHPSVAAFEWWWVQEHDQAWIQRQRDYLEAVGVTGEEATEFVEELSRARYTAVHADRQVWVIHLQVTADLPFLLARNSETGYVTSPAVALPDEPEAIPLDRLRPHWAEHAKGRHDRVRREAAERRAQDRRALTLHQRIMLAELAANDQQLDLRSEFRQLHRMIRDDRPDDTILRQLVLIETRAYREKAA